VGGDGFEPPKAWPADFIPATAFAASMTLFVGWTLSSSGLDAPR